MTQQGSNSVLDDAVKVLGSSAQLARAIGVSPAFVSQMRSGARAIPPKLCKKIELATQRVVTRARLRPDVFGPLDEQVSVEIQ
ncbi:transcriptional regulator [Microbulbifer sp. DLAB2-AF]|uniref:transcriptional regulator n=1 Tax=Microbulbifer sp. DLAB2-AF TaxID=3243395 RepID=UPI004039133A